MTWIIKKLAPQPKSNTATGMKSQNLFYSPSGTKVEDLRVEWNLRRLISIKFRFNVVVDCWWFWSFLWTRILNSTFNNDFHVWCLSWIFQEGLKPQNLWAIKFRKNFFKISRVFSEGWIQTKTSLQSLADFIGRLRCSLLYVIILSATNFAMRLVWEIFTLVITRYQW